MSIIQEHAEAFRSVPWLRTVSLTGAGGGGKTTLVTEAITFMRQTEWEYVIASEAAREVIAAGFRPDKKSEKSVYEFQRKVFQVTLQKEMSCFESAKGHYKTGKSVLLLCDRGLIDGQAYLSKKYFQMILEEFGMTYEEALLRYDAIINLVTAAEGAEEHYVIDAQRTESAEEARILQVRTDEAWKDHPRLWRIDNSTDFNTKIDRAIAALNNIMRRPRLAHSS